MSAAEAQECRPFPRWLLARSRASSMTSMENKMSIRKEGHRVCTIRCRKGGCHGVPAFGLEGEEPCFCREHKEEGMENVLRGRCEKKGCTKSPTYGFVGHVSLPHMAWVGKCSPPHKQVLCSPSIVCLVSHKPCSYLTKSKLVTEKDPLGPGLHGGNTAPPNTLAACVCQLVLAGRQRVHPFPE
ncbi:unnamed protein product [Discosporangium mesarthrocarpum]